MDPTTEAPELLSKGFLYASNKHTNDWIIETEIHTQQINGFMEEADGQYASKQNRMDRRKIELSEIYNSVERTFEARIATNLEENAGMKEDYLSNETDPSISLNK